MDAQLEKLSVRAKAAGTTDLFVTRDGTTLVDAPAGIRKPIYLSSAGKPLVGLAIARAIALGRIGSVEDRLSDYLPEWRQGRKRYITIEQVLTHRTGLQNFQDAGLELECSTDVGQLAIAAELDDTPGQVVRYNNKAVALLGPLIKRTVGLAFDKFVESELFEPLGVCNFEWVRDGSGQPAAYGPFVLQADDVEKLGRLLLQRGMWAGRQILPEDWIVKSLKSANGTDGRLGYLWWRLTANADQERLLAVYHGGFRGNFLVLVPEAKVVAVRLVSIEAFQGTLTQVYPQFISDVIEWCFPGEAVDASRLVL